MAKLCSNYTDPKPIRRGRIGLQFNKGERGVSQHQATTAGLEPTIQWGDLTGWKVFPDKQSTFTVVDGEIDVKSGPGTLESEAQFGDFVLQLEAKTNGKGLNSGVFFRSIPGEYNNGYESQIQNAFKDGRSHEAGRLRHGRNLSAVKMQDAWCPMIWSG